MQKFSFRQIIEISNGFKGGFSPCLMKRAKVHFNAPRVGRKVRVDRQGKLFPRYSKPYGGMCHQNKLLSI